MSVAAARIALDRMEESEPVVQAQTLRSADSLAHGLILLERTLGAARFTLTRVRPLDWEARSFGGDVGRGVSLTDAVYALLDSL